MAKLVVPHSIIPGCLIKGKEPIRFLNSVGCLKDYWVKYTNRKIQDESKKEKVKVNCFNVVKLECWYGNLIIQIKNPSSQKMVFILAHRAIIRVWLEVRRQKLEEKVNIEGMSFESVFFIRLSSSFRQKNINAKQYKHYHAQRTWIYNIN